MDPATLAADLGIAPSTLRSWLRHTYPRADADRGSSWALGPDQVAAARRQFTGSPPSKPRATTRPSGRAGSDESYVIDLCDEVLGEVALRQHRFSWLRGDPGAGGVRVVAATVDPPTRDRPQRVSERSTTTGPLRRPGDHRSRPMHGTADLAAAADLRAPGRDVAIDAGASPARSVDRAVARTARRGSADGRSPRVRATASASGERRARSSSSMPATLEEIGMAEQASVGVSRWVAR